MSGRWNNRAEGDTGEEAGRSASRSRRNNNNTRTRLVVLSRMHASVNLFSLFFFKKRGETVVSRYFRDACVVAEMHTLPSLSLSLSLSLPLSLSLAAALTDAAHTTEASRGLLPRSVPPAGEALKPERRWRHGSGCKERQGGQWRAPLSPPSSASMRAGTERVEGRGCG